MNQWVVGWLIILVAVIGWVIVWMDKPDKGRMRK